MKTRNVTASATTTKPVEIRITVTRFREVLAPGKTSPCTTYTMDLARKDPRAYIKGDDLYIKGPGAGIRFTLASSAADKKSYYPIGIAFVRESTRNESDAQRLGFLNFPQSETRMKGRTLSILDTFKDRSKRIRFKFSVIIQRGSDGAIGIIDPGIVHEPTHH
jgi:hypothetical protein